MEDCTKESQSLSANVEIIPSAKLITVKAWRSRITENHRRLLPQEDC